MKYYRKSGDTMGAHKFSVSIKQQQYDFIENYQASHHYKTRSEVIRDALYLLQQKQLEACYREANNEIEDDFDHTASDGMEDNETW